MAKTNKALFRVVGNTTSASSARGYNAVAGESLVFELEDPTGVLVAIWETYDSNNPQSPLASLGAPLFPFTGAFGQPIFTAPTTPFSAAAVVPSDAVPASNSWHLRCTVSTASGTQSFTRSINRIGSKSRKPVPGESTENSNRGWADDVATLIENGVSTPGAPGVGLVGAVDALITSTIAHTGTASIDGVSMVANVSTVLDIGNSDPTKRGKYLVQSGAWTRPADYALDAQVVVGQTIFVKGGGISVPASGENWQRTSGLTIAGASTWDRLTATGTGRAQVRAIQTAAFPGTYSGNTWTATATGALSTTIFDGLTIAIGEDVEFGQGTSAVSGAAHVGNGIFRRGVDTASKPTFARRLDLDSSADFVGGAAYDVLDGTLNKGTRRQLLNQGAIVLGTDALSFGPVRERDLKEIDVTKPPYNVQFGVDATAAGALAEADQIDQAIYDASLTGRAVRLGDGWFKKNTPILMRANCKLYGAGQDRTVSYSSGQQGGWGLIMVGATTPFIAGPTVDASAVNASIKMWDPTNVDGRDDVFLNISHAGLRFKKWTAYTYRTIVRFDSLAVPAQISSTRGKLAASDALDTLDEYIVTSAGVVFSSLTIWSASSLLALSGGAVPTITGGVIPDDIYFKIKCTFAGPRGTFKFMYSINAGVSWIEELKSDTSNALRGRLTGLTINWTNASCALTDSWTNYETKTLTTPSAKVTAGSTNYMVTARWDGSVANGGTNTYTLHVNAAGSAYDASPQSTTFSLANGVINQRVFQETIFGRAVNAHAYELDSDRNALQYYLGSFAYWDTVQSVSGTSSTVMGTGTGTPKAYFIPQPNGGLGGWGNRLIAPGGGELWGFGISIPDAPNTHVVFRRFNNQTFLNNFEFADFSINCGISRKGGFLIDGPSTAYKARNLTVAGGARGYIHRGTGYTNDVSGLKTSASDVDLAFINCELPLSGVNDLRGSGVLFVALVSGGRQTGSLWLNPGGTPMAGAVLPANSSLGFQWLSIDDEGCAGFTYAVIQCSVSAALHIKGAVACGNSNITPFLIDSAVNQKGIFVPDFGLQCNNLAKEVFSIIDTGVTPFELGPCFPTTGIVPPITDRAGYVRRYGTDLKELDAGVAPYNVRGAEVVDGSLVDYAPAIKRALRKLFLAGGGTLRLPMGYILAIQTLHIPSGVRITGAGRDKTTIVQGPGRTGGWQMHLGTLAPWTVVSPYVDATSVGSGFAAPLQMWGAPNQYYDPKINLSHVGWFYNKINTLGWAAYDTRIQWRQPALGVGLGGHVYSTRGRCAGGMPLHTCDQIQINDDGSVVAWLRAWHPSKVKRSGSGAVVLTLSGTPLPEGTMLRVEILTAGARGTFRFRVSECDGGSWGWSGGISPQGNPVGILSAATNTLDGHLAGVVLNWSNASAATDDVWKNWELLSVYTAASKIVANTNQQIALTFDGTTANLRVSTVGSAYDTPSGTQTTTTTLTGAYVQQQIYEETLMGSGCNAVILEAGTDSNAAHGHLGAVLSQNTIGSFSGNAPAALVSAANTADLWYLFQPNTLQQVYAVDGDTTTPVVGYLAVGSIAAEVINGRNANGNQNFDHHVGVDNLTLMSYNPSAGGGILVDGGVVETTIDQVRITGHAYGFQWQGTGYYNCFSNLNVLSSRLGVGLTSCESAFVGTMVVGGGGINYAEISCGSRAHCNVWVNPGGTPYAGIICLTPQSNHEINMTVDGEGSAGYKFAACVSSPLLGSAIQWNGTCASNSRQSFYIDNGGGNGSNGDTILNCAVGYIDNTDTPCLVTTHGAPVGRLLGGPNFRGQSGLAVADRPNFFRPYGSNQKEFDVTLPPYSVVTAATPTETSVLPECVSKVNQAIYDCWLLGGGTIQLPMGWINPTSLTDITPVVPLLRRENVKIVGPGMDQGGIGIGGQASGGWSVLNVGPGVNGDPIVTAHAAVDSSSSTPLKMYSTTPLTDGGDPFFSVTHTGMVFDQWSKYTVALYYNSDNYAAGGQLFSTRGAMSIQEAISQMDGIAVNGDGLGGINATLRVWSPSAVVANAAGPTLTITGSIPTDCWLKVKITTAGARGTFKFKVSINGGATWSKAILSAATNDLSTVFPLLGSVTLNWTNASAATTDSWQNWQTRSCVKGNGTIANGVNYSIIAQWDPAGANKLSLYVSTIGSSYDASPAQSAVFTLTGAVINAQQFEETIIGPGVNTRLLAGASDVGAAQGWLGSFQYLKTAPTLSGTVPSTMLRDLGGQRLYWVPGVNATAGKRLLGPDGVLYGWSCEVTNGSQNFPAFFPSRRVAPTSFFHYSRLEEFSIINERSGNRQCGGILEEGSTVGCDVYNVRVVARDGYIHSGIGFYNHVEGLRVNTRRIGIGFVGPGETPLRGLNYIEGNGINFACVNGGGINTGTLWINPQGRPYCHTALLNASIVFENLQVDDEGTSGGYIYPATLEASTNGLIRISGGLSLSNSVGTPILASGGGGNCQGQITLDCLLSTAGAPLDCLVSIRDTQCVPVLSGQHWQYIASDSTEPPKCDRAGKLVPFGGSPYTLLSDSATSTITPAGSQVRGVVRVVMKASTTTQVNAITLGTTGVVEGTRVHVRIEAQGNNVTIANGGGAGGTLDTVTASSTLSADYVLELDPTTLAPNWFRY